MNFHFQLNDVEEFETRKKIRAKIRTLRDKRDGKSV